MMTAKLGRYQFSLRALLAVPVGVAIAVSIAAWWIPRYPTGQSGAWSSKLVGYKHAGNPVCFVGAYTIDRRDPTIAYFVLCESGSQFKHPHEWMERGTVEHRRIWVHGREVRHHHGNLQLFVDDGSGHPVRVVLDPADARKYFGHEHDVFVSYEVCEEFWHDVLQKKYSVFPGSTDGDEVGEARGHELEGTRDGGS